jgi:dihydroneopterin aldolase
MGFYGYHGALPEENKIGQRFFVDVALEVCLKEAGSQDDLQKTINYANVYENVKTIVEGPVQKLIEAVAELIANDLLGKYENLLACTVKVTKPDPPIDGHLQSVAVEIRREKQ